MVAILATAFGRIGVTAFTLDRNVLVDAFCDLGKRAWAMGKTIEIAVYGGSALMLSYDWRLATKDVDGVYEADRSTVRALAAAIAAERDWPANWLNDGVKGFLSVFDSQDGVKRLYGEFPAPDRPGLRVFVPRPEYLFAMKCRAMRVGGVDDHGDFDDIRQLAQEIGLADAVEALALVGSFYPRAQLEPKVQFGIEELFSNTGSGAEP